MSTCNDQVPCVRDFHLRPAADQINAVLVLDTDLTIQPGQACNDMRLGDLLCALEDMVDLATPTDGNIACVEIRCQPVRH